MQLIFSKSQTRNFRSWISHFLSAVLVLISCLFAGGGLSGAAAEPEAVNPAGTPVRIWHQLEAGLNGTVFSIVKSGSSYYVGGVFTNAGDIDEADYLARWDGSQWHAVAGGINGSVRTIAIKDANIYVGGQFTEIDGDTAMSHVAYWNGATWNSMAGGVDGIVYDLAVAGEYVYVGGDFSGVDANPDNDNIARWHDSSGWSVLGGELVGTVDALAVAGSQLFVGGSFTDAGGVEAADRVARYNGTWNAMNTGFSSGTVYDLTMCGSITYAAGSSGVSVSYFDSSLEPDAWVTMAGLGATVNTVDCLGGEIYVGGYFTDGGGDPDADYLAHWNGSAWEAVGAGFSIWRDLLHPAGTEQPDGWWWLQL